MTPPASTAAGRRTASPAMARPHPAKPSARVAPPRVPRRLSGPAAGRVAPQPARRLPSSRLWLVRPVVTRVRALPQHSLIDRLVRGRAWIPLLGVMLAGIVASQVEILKLGSSMGRWIERSSVLSARNQQLRDTVAGLADDQRIESAAAAMGMVMPSPTSLAFLSARSASPVAALAHVHLPDATQFLASLPAGGQPALTDPTATASGTTTQGIATTTTGPVSTGALSGQAGAQSPSSASPSSGTAGGATPGSQSAVATQPASTSSQGGGSPSQSSSQTSSAAAFPGGAAVAPPAATTRSSGG